MFACNAIIFNTESSRRGEQFVTRKIVKGAVEIIKEKRKCLELGNLNSQRDWTYVKDTIDGVYRQMQHFEPDEFVFASGKTYTIQEFLEKVFNYLGLNHKEYIKINPTLFRPAEVDVLCGDASKAKKILGWKPNFDLDDIVKDMVYEELKNYK